MIKSLYPIFQHWSEKGSVYIISDTHFDDEDCELMDAGWITPDRHVENIKRYAHKNDTLIHLGDVGNPEYLNKLKCYKVLIMGNHDQSIEKFKQYFNEVYAGPLVIAEKIILSHEPIEEITWALNIHGHNHSGCFHTDDYHINLASNVMCYQVFNLGEYIKHQGLTYIDSIHRQIIDEAIKRKEYDLLNK